MKVPTAVLRLLPAREQTHREAKKNVRCPRDRRDYSGHDHWQDSAERHHHSEHETQYVLAAIDWQYEANCEEPNEQVLLNAETVGERRSKGASVDKRASKRGYGPPYALGGCTVPLCPIRGPALNATGNEPCERRNKDDSPPVRYRWQIGASQKMMTYDSAMEHLPSKMKNHGNERAQRDTVSHTIDFR
jgi:hypothetical protein